MTVAERIYLSGLLGLAAAGCYLTVAVNIDAFALTVGSIAAAVVHGLFATARSK